MLKKLTLMGLGSVVALPLTACGNPDGAAGNEPEIVTESAADMTAETVVSAAENSLALLEGFRSAAVNGCNSRYQEMTEPDGEFAGATILCQGEISSEEPYSIVFIQDGNSDYPAGSMVFFFSGHMHPMAYEELKELMLDVAGIDGASARSDAAGAVTRYQMAAANMPTNGARSLFQGTNGSYATVQTNFPAGGWLTVRVYPAE